MSIEENLIVRSSQIDKTKALQKELEDACALVKTYENLMDELRLENSTNLKLFTHELANPLQILSMTIESLQDRPTQDVTAALMRMKSSTDKMTATILSIRKQLARNIRPTTGPKVV
jgi:signal transduction histidine kinase